MINFRFHLVSLVAVFLALALGVVIGSTLVDRAIVDGLRDRIDEVEDNADATASKNVQLLRDVDEAREYAKAALPHLVNGRLRGANLVVVAARGVDGGPVRELTDTLRLAGASFPGIMWLEPSLASKEAKVEAKLAEAVTDPYRRGDALRLGAVEALGRRLALGPAGPDSAAPPLEGAEDLLVSLAAARFIAFDVLGGPDVDLAAWPPPGARILVIDGTEARMKTAEATLPLVRAAAVAGAPTAMAEIFDQSSADEKDGVGRGDVVGTVRRDGELISRVSTVDDAQESPGRAALVFALEELGGGRIGHYGMAAGATRQIPEPPPVPAASPAPAVTTRSGS